STTKLSNAELHNITFQSNAPLAGTDAKTATGKLGVYPNPSGGVFNIQIPTSINSASGAELFVTDALGRNILRKPIQAGTNSVQQLDLQGNSPGLYRVVLSNSTGNKLGSASVMLK
ncbi:MAG: T9SS type A sorting domain-containing protein, partial [Bacteroidota bacterium]